MQCTPICSALVTRPIPTCHAEHEKGREGRATELAAAIEWPILPRWQVEVEFPFVIRDPTDGPAVGGLSDITLENKVLLYKSVEYRLLVSTGVEVKFPSGSERRGLGGELAIEPFLTAGIVLGPFDLLGEVAYEWTLKPEREEQLTTGLALGYPASRWFTPFLELRGVTLTRGEDQRTQLYLVPGFNMRPRPGVTVRVGVQLPITEAKDFDYQIRGAVVWEF